MDEMKDLENFEDELADIRFKNNSETLFLILLRLLSEKKEISLTDYNDKVREILGDNVFTNGDYYAFLVHLCGKKHYRLNK